MRVLITEYVSSQCARVILLPSKLVGICHHSSWVDPSAENYRLTLSLIHLGSWILKLHISPQNSVPDLNSQEANKAFATFLEDMATIAALRNETLVEEPGNKFKGFLVLIPCVGGYHRHYPRDLILNIVTNLYTLKTRGKPISCCGLETPVELTFTEDQMIARDVTNGASVSHLLTDVIKSIRHCSVKYSPEDYVSLPYEFCCKVAETCRMDLSDTPLRGSSSGVTLGYLYKVREDRMIEVTTPSRNITLPRSEFC